MNPYVFEIITDNLFRIDNVYVAGDFFPQISFKISSVDTFSYELSLNKSLNASESEEIYDVILFINGVVYTLTINQTLDIIEQRCSFLQKLLGF